MGQIATTSRSQGLTVKAYRGPGSALIAYDLDPHLTKNLAGFAIKRTAPTGESAYLLNRLDFTHEITKDTLPHQRTFTPSNVAPFQKFRWIDFPSDVHDGRYSYEVAVEYFGKGGRLEEGPRAEVAIEIAPRDYDRFRLGFTRGYLSSQAYATRFGNAPLRPGAGLLFDTRPYEAQYEWLGFEARRILRAFAQECHDDPASTVDVFAYDLDEPDFVETLVSFGKRLRIFLDDSPLHTKKGAREIEAGKRLLASAGADNVRRGHFQRFAHSKVIIQKRHGKPVRVLTGSANFSVRGLYVQANSVLVFDDPGAAALYEEAFELAFADPRSPAKFRAAPVAKSWATIEGAGLPATEVSFAPHTTALLSLGKVADAIRDAKSSVLYAVMEMGGGGPVLQALRNIGSQQKLFAYGMTQKADGDLEVQRATANSELADFAYLTKQVPEPFREEWSGGMGQVIHHKFVVLDFNDYTPRVFTGSSNLAKGGEEANGDNLLAIADRSVATAYAVEAIRLVDHYHFRVAMRRATRAKPLQLQGAGTRAPWWEPYYDDKNIKSRERQLFVR